MITAVPQFLPGGGYTVSVGLVTLVISRFFPYFGTSAAKVFSAPRVGRSPGGFPGQRSRTKGVAAFAMEATSRAAIRYAIDGVFFNLAPMAEDPVPSGRGNPRVLPWQVSICGLSCENPAPWAPTPPGGCAT